MTTKKVYVRPDMHGFVGWHGQNVRLNGGDEYDIDAPIVVDLPGHFTAEKPADLDAPEQPKRRGRRG